MRRKPSPHRFHDFEVPSSEGPVRIGLMDGSLHIWDAEEEIYEGWATIEDLAEGLVRWAHLSSTEAHTVATEAVRQWEEWLGGRRHRNPAPLKRAGRRRHR